MPALLTDALFIAAGIVLIVVARVAGRRRGTRWDSLVALRMGEVLITEVVGAFLIGYGIGLLVFPTDRAAAPGPPGPRGGPPRAGFFGTPPQFLLGIVAAIIDVIPHIDLRNLMLSGRATRNPIVSYVGWDARVVAAIPAHGYGEIAMRDGMGNVTSIAATADVDIAEGTHVRVTGTRDLNLVVSPIADSP